MELAVIEYSGSAPERVVRAVSESGAQTVVTTPILGETAETAMQELPPEVRLVRLEYGSGRGGARGESSGSTGIVGLSRIEAFSDLGSQLGEILDDKKYSEGGLGAVGMWYTGTKGRKEEYEAFIASFSAVCSPERLEIEGVNTVPDSSAVRRYLEDIPKKGVFFWNRLHFLSKCRADYQLSRIGLRHCVRISLSGGEFPRFNAGSVDRISICRGRC